VTTTKPVAAGAIEGEPGAGFERARAFSWDRTAREVDALLVAEL